MSEPEPAAGGGEAAAVNRDEILIDFQSCTGIEDVEEAIRYLEQCDWNLVDAINNALPPATQTLPSESITIKPTTPPPPQPAPKKPLTKSPPSSSSSSSSIEDFPILDEEEEDEDFTPPSSTTNNSSSTNRHLIPDPTASESNCTVQFCNNFASRYGPCHPMFYQGELEEALKEATARPVRERRLLAVYLHHDGSVLSNVFCTQVLCSEGVVGVMSSNFVIWGWDVSREVERGVLLAAMSKAFGASGVGTVRSLEVDRYPVLIIVGRRGGTNEICSVVHANTITTPDSLISTLLHTHELYRAQQAVEAHEEDERLARERVISEQNAAYEASLAADIAKAEARRAAQSQLKSREEAEREKEEREREERERVRGALPPEPESGEEGVCTLRVRGPGGVRVRRFRGEERLKVLVDYLYGEGWGRGEWRFLYSHPKRDLLEAHDETATLGSIFSTQDTLIVEQRR